MSTNDYSVVADIMFHTHTNKYRQVACGKAVPPSVLQERIEHDLRGYGVESFPLTIRANGIRIGTVDHKGNLEWWYFDTEKPATVGEWVNGASVQEIRWSS